MKIPLNPPNVEQLFARLAPNELAKIFQHSSPLAAGKYLHWDDLRHRPPPEGLSSEKWWLAVSLARGSISQPLPLTDKEGNPFRLATPEPLLLHLHHIDRDAAGQIKTPTSSSIHENRAVAADAIGSFNQVFLLFEPHDRQQVYDADASVDQFETRYYRLPSRLGIGNYRRYCDGKI